MSFLPGICLCYAPGVSASAEIRYCLYAGGFQEAHAISNDPVFFDSSGSPLTGGRMAQAPGEGPFCKIEFFLRAEFIGRFLSDIGSPRAITGFMANANYTGGSSNRHRRGSGRYVVVSRAIVDRLASALNQDSPLPSQGGIGSQMSEFLDILDQMRGSNSQLAAWFNNLGAALRGSMNQAVLAYLAFPEPGAVRRGLH